jgi:hypothetical protein
LEELKSKVKNSGFSQLEVCSNTLKSNWNVICKNMTNEKICGIYPDDNNTCRL